MAATLASVTLLNCSTSTGSATPFAGGRVVDDEQIEVGRAAAGCPGRARQKTAARPADWRAERSGRCVPPESTRSMGPVMGSMMGLAGKAVGRRSGRHKGGGHLDEAREGS